MPAHRSNRIRIRSWWIDKRISQNFALLHSQPDQMSLFYNLAGFLVGSRNNKVRCLPVAMIDGSLCIIE